MGRHFGECRKGQEWSEVKKVDGSKVKPTEAVVVPTSYGERARWRLVEYRKEKGRDTDDGWRQMRSAGPGKRGRHTTECRWVGRWMLVLVGVVQ